MDSIVERVFFALFLLLFLSMVSATDIGTLNTVSNVSLNENLVYKCDETKDSFGNLLLVCNDGSSDIRIRLVDFFKEVSDCKSIFLSNGNKLTVCKAELLFVAERKEYFEPIQTVTNTNYSTETSISSATSSTNVYSDAFVEPMPKYEPKSYSENLGVEYCKTVTDPKTGKLIVVCEQAQKQVETKNMAEMNMVQYCEKIVLEDGSVKSICKTIEGGLINAKEEVHIKELDECKRVVNNGVEEIVCRTDIGEIVSTENKERIENIEECKKIIDSNGIVNIVCNNNLSKVVSGKEINVGEVQLCKTVVSSTGERLVVCQNEKNEIMPVFENTEKYEMVEGGIKIKMREKEKSFQMEKEYVERMLIEAKLDLSEIEKFKEAAEKKELNFERKVKTEKIVKDQQKIESRFTVSVENSTGNALENITVIEVIPKEVALSALEVTSDYNFTIIQDDPVIEFVIPLVLPGQKAEVVYAVGKDVDGNVIDDMQAPIARFDSQISASECGVNTVGAEIFDLRFDIRHDSLADVTLTITSDYSEACLGLLGVQSEDYGLFECPQAIAVTQDAMFEGMGFFTQEQGTCEATFSDSKITLQITTVTDMIVTPLVSNNSEVTFRDWKFVENLGNSSLTISIPEGTKLTSYYPRSNPEGSPDYEKGLVFWNSIPLEKPSVKYQSQGIDWFFIIGISIFIIVILGGGGILFLLKKKKDAKISQIKFIKLKMQKLEQSYLLRQMDETTYRRLMEQYQLQLNELEAEFVKKKI
jgi:hypothetical protein